MVIPASWPDPYYGANPPPGWTIYYGDNFTHRPGHISWQHPVVRPDPRWPIRYGRLSTPAGRKIRPNQVHGLPQSQSLTRSRFKGDIWHLFHQFSIPLSHGLRRPFAQALSAAIFLTDLDDKWAVKEVLKHKGITYKSKLKSHPWWILSRVRRYVPPPEILFGRVAAVMKTYGPLKDATSGEPLFNGKCWDTVKNLLKHIRNGYYSDPPDVPLFYKIRKDRDGLSLYRCCCGTNDVEGGVHQNLIRYFESFNVSPRCAINMILVYCVRHNI